MTSARAPRKTRTAHSTNRRSHVAASRRTRRTRDSRHCRAHRPAVRARRTANKPTTIGAHAAIARLRSLSVRDPGSGRDGARLDHARRDGSAHDSRLRARLELDCRRHAALAPLPSRVPDITRWSTARSDTATAIHPPSPRSGTSCGTCTRCCATCARSRIQAASSSSVIRWAAPHVRSSPATSMPRRQ